MEWRDTQMKMAVGIATIFLLSLLVSVSGHQFSDKIGVNYGLLGNNLPTASESIKLIKKINGSRVKIYGADAQILNALNGTSLQVSVMVPNNLIVNMSSNQSMANEWIQINVLPYYPQTLIRYILVGNEILSFTDEFNKKTWFCLVPTMKKIKFALRTYNITKVKVSTPMAMDVLESSFPPSNGTFRSDVALSVVRPMLQFLGKTKSFYFVDVYPYFPWSENYPNINLDYALFNGGPNYTDPISGLTYTNLLDQMLDAIIFAMKKVGFPDVRLWISETGWPNSCNIDQIGGNPHNAAIYNRNLVKKLTTKPPLGTPARPGVILPAFLFSLYNENQKPSDIGVFTTRTVLMFIQLTFLVRPRLQITRLYQREPTMSLTKGRFGALWGKELICRNWDLQFRMLALKVMPLVMLFSPGKNAISRIYCFCTRATPSARIGLNSEVKAPPVISTVLQCRLLKILAADLASTRV